LVAWYEISIFWRTPDANTRVCHYDDGASDLIKVETLESCRRELRIAAAVLLNRSQQDHSGMTSRSISAEIGKSFIGCDQPASFSLNALPENLVGGPLPPLLS
jgi:hypothetical protein